jgi:hypothetical protein
MTVKEGKKEKRSHKERHDLLHIGLIRVMHPIIAHRAIRRGVKVDISSRSTMNLPFFLAPLLHRRRHFFHISLNSFRTLNGNVCVGKIGRRVVGSFKEVERGGKGGGHGAEKFVEVAGRGAGQVNGFVVVVRADTCS